MCSVVHVFYPAYVEVTPPGSDVKSKINGCASTLLGPVLCYRQGSCELSRYRPIKFISVLHLKIAVTQNLGYIPNSLAHFIDYNPGGHDCQIESGVTYAVFRISPKLD